MKSVADSSRPARFVEDFVEAILTGLFITAVNVALGDMSVKWTVIVGLLWPVGYFCARRIRRRIGHRREVAKTERVEPRP